MKWHEDNSSKNSHKATSLTCKVQGINFLGGKYLFLNVTDQILCSNISKRQSLKTMKTLFTNYYKQL